MTAFALPQLLVERLGWLLIHSIWQFSLLAMIIAIVLRLPRPASAVVRYWASVLALAAMLAAPAVTYVAFPDNASPIETVKSARPTISAPPRMVIAPAPPVETEFINNRGGTLPPVEVETKALPSTDSPRAAVAATIPWHVSLKSAIAPWLEECVAFWCLGVLVFGLRPAMSWYSIHRLRRVGVSPVSAEVSVLLAQAISRLGIGRSVGALQSNLAQVPMVVGYVRPLILLPAAVATGLSASQLEAILLHELAHVRRHDWLVNLLQTFIETLFFYHPAVWWLSSRIRQEREHCCDELAAQVLGDRANYGRALLALEELRGTAPLLSLGAKGGSLLARIRRLANAESPRTNIGPLACVALMASVVIGIGIWSVGYAGENSQGEANQERESDEQLAAIEPWGPESNGLRCRIVAVSPDSDPESPETAIPVNAFARSNDVTFAVELKNVSEEPVTLLGVRERARRSLTGGSEIGELAPSFFAPHFFEFEFTDANGNPIARSKRELSDALLRITDVAPHEISPGQSLTVLLQPGHFKPPMDYSLASGEYRVRVQYHGPSEEKIAPAKKRSPNIAQGNAWTGNVISEHVTFSVKDDPDRSTAEDLQWGQAVDGLRAAVEFRNPEDHPPAKYPPNQVPLNSKLNVIFHIQNVSDDVVTFGSVTPRQGDELFVENMTGEEQAAQTAGFSGRRSLVRWTLRPGEVATLSAADLAIAADEQTLDVISTATGFRWITDPGTFSLQYTIVSRNREKDEHGNPHFPGMKVWTGELVTGQTQLTVLKSENARNPQQSPRDNPMETLVSISAKDVPLKQALENVCRQAGVTLNLPADELKLVELSPDTPVTVIFQNLALKQGLQSIIGATGNRRLQVEMEGTTVTFRRRTKELLPEFLQPLYGKGLGARVDRQGNVVEISVSDEEFVTDELLEKCSTLPRLKSFRIYHPKQITSRGIEAIGRMASLESLTIWGQSLSSEDLAEITKLTRLQELSLHEAEINDADLKQLAELEDLRVLDLDGNNISDAGLVHVGKLRRLEELTLVNSSRYGKRPQEPEEVIADIGSLDELQVARPSRLTDAGLAHLAALADLRYLNLTSVGPGDANGSPTLQVIAKLPKLETLHLTGLHFGDSAMPQVAECANLKILTLTSTNVTDAGLAAIGDLKQLEAISLISEKLTEDGLAVLADLPRLRNVRLRASGLTDRIFEILAECESVETLDLGDFHAFNRAISLSVENAAKRWEILSSENLEQLRSLPRLKHLTLNGFAILGAAADKLMTFTNLDTLRLNYCHPSREHWHALRQAIPHTEITDWTSSSFLGGINGDNFP